MQGRSIRVLLAHHHGETGSRAKAALAAAKGVEVIGEASTAAQTIAMAQQYQPDVVVLDLESPDGDSLEVAKAITARATRPRVLVMTHRTEDQHVVPILQSGAAGCVAKTAADHELVQAVRAVASGDLYVRPRGALAAAAARTMQEPATFEREAYESLSDRERNVLRLTAEGYSAPEIGERLSISPKTVDTYKQRVHEKLGLDHRSDYVRFALKVGLLTLSE